jgi:hypothetical protein
VNTTLFEEDRNKIGVYLLHNDETGFGYIGSGVLGSRQRVHDYLLRNGKHWNYRLQKAYNQNPNFEFIAAVVGDNADDVRREALALEQALIDEHWGDPQLLNLAADVETPMRGYKHRPEDIEKSRQAMLKRWSDPEFRDKVTVAQKNGWQEMSDTRKEQFRKDVSEGLKRAYAGGVRSSNRGQKRSEEFCVQNSRKIAEKWQDPEYRENQRKAREKSRANNARGETL